MTTTSPAPAFTADDVAALADLIRHHIPAGMTPEAGIAVAVHEAQVDEERRFRRFFYGDHAYRKALLGALAGTYDEFRAA